MPADVPPLASSVEASLAEASLAEALAGLLPASLTPAQRARYAGIAAIVKATTDHVPHATNEFTEPAPVFDLQVRQRKTRR